jgi:hypothetical protein
MHFTSIYSTKAAGSLMFVAKTTSTITIRQQNGDPDLKSMLQDLRKNENPHNPYRRRSESEIAKMVLADSLIAEHRRICGSSLATK